MSTDEYRDQLARLRSEVGATADLVCDRYASAVTVLASGDASAAERVIDGDRELNDWYLDIEVDCLGLLALYQPVAGNLRLIVAAFKIVTDLERIGDLATNLASYGQQVGGQLPAVADVPAVAETAGSLVTDAAGAFTKRDAERARAAAARDEALDQACQRQSETVARALVTDRPDAADQRLKRATRALLAIRDTERIGDHAVNICARTVHLVENDPELIY
jgi:phosphate transport system regulatory protein PhoU